MKDYIRPILEIVVFEEDIVTASISVDSSGTTDFEYETPPVPFG